MPVIIAGRTGATWGLSEVSGMIAQSGESESSIEENPSKNADGEVKMTSFYNPTRSIEYGGIYTGFSAALGEGLAVSSILLVGSPNGSVFCKGLRMREVNDGFVSISAKAIQYNLF